MQWNNILIAELIFVGLLLLGLGLVKLPRIFMRRKLQSGSPWGYYADRVPKADPGYCAGNTQQNPYYNTSAGFNGIEAFGEQGQFSGFGELGEYGESFTSGHE
jgi:hypothetical protein